MNRDVESAKQEEKAESSEIKNDSTSSSAGIGLISQDQPSKADKIIFEKPPLSMTQQLRPLYVKVWVEGQPINRVLVDNGSVVNVIPSTTLKKLGKTMDDVVPTDVAISGFNGGSSNTKGILPLEITIGGKTSFTAFFIIDSTAAYNLLLGRDWIHPNMCIPSTLHQMLIFWDGNEVKIVEADNKPFIARVYSAEAALYDETVKQLGRKLIFSGRPSRTLKMLLMDHKTNEEKKRQAFRAACIRLKAYLAEKRLAREEQLYEEVSASTADIIEEGFEKLDAIQLEDLESAPSRMEDNKVEVQYPLLEINVEMPGLSRKLVEHRLPIKKDFQPYKQPPRRMSSEVMLKIKEEIERLLKAGFIRTVRYVEWLSNVVPVTKKNGKLRVCVDFCNLNNATPKDEYPMPVADQLIDSAAKHEILSFMDGHSGYNQI
ncbi:uncharacterized protein LOC132267525 [Cornus florida]|uniref:uncharacterized protein LOC132267525 n=1 Tax=Cornus florida TaxID=4283 RepID=UPI0028A208C6|nr:uncharacterized protein LOC132267525 [Cornus florida]